MTALIQVLVVKIASLGGFGADLPPNHINAADAARITESASAEARPDSPGAGSSQSDGSPREVIAKQPRFPRPEHLRGIYVNAWAAGNTERLDRLLRLAAATEVNTFVIDFKDVKGHVSATSSVALAQEVGADAVIRIPNIRRMLRKIEEAGVYPIARITAFKDPLLASKKRSLMLRTTDGRRKSRWISPFSTVARQYLHDISREAAALGFPAVQWDYVRFPVTRKTEADTKMNAYVGSEGRSRSGIIRQFLLESRAVLAPLGVKVQADVFAQSILVRDDVGIGQHWESFVDVVDSVVPMMYPSHYAPGALGYRNPNAHPYPVIRRSLRWATGRSAEVPGAGKTIPFLQAFTRGAPEYGKVEIRDQIRAAKDAGIDEWFLWHPGSQYSRRTFRLLAKPEPQTEPAPKKEQTPVEPPPLVAMDSPEPDSPEPGPAAPGAAAPALGAPRVPSAAEIGAKACLREVAVTPEIWTWGAVKR